jgi:hypothetical protein
MIGRSGSVGDLRSKRRSKNSTCKWCSRTPATKSRSKGPCVHFFRLLSSRKWAGRYCHCASAWHCITLYHFLISFPLRYSVRALYFFFFFEYLARCAHDGSCLSWRSSQTSSFSDAHSADHRVSARYPGSASGVQSAEPSSAFPQDGIWKWQNRLFIRGGRPRNIAMFLSAE